MRILLPAVGLACGVYIGYTQWGYERKRTPQFSINHESSPPTRASMLDRARQQSFDVLVIGGGATGTSIALDAVSRGLNTVMIEQEDFASGTSSKSTKLVHGGVRYLEKAVFNLDSGQLSLVFEALNERKRLLTNAKFLASPLAIMTPCYKLWEVPYYWAGLKMYDLVAGTQGLTISRFVSANESKRIFPTLATSFGGNSLKGTVIYYDGQFDDTRLCISIGLTAAIAGAVILNHSKAEQLLFDEAGKVSGALVRDQMTQELILVKAKKVVNATGALADQLRGEAQPPMVRGSSGVHITLPDYYSPMNTGLIVPKTKDGRVLFMLPWLDHTVAGTTDNPCEPELHPSPTEEDIQFILDSIDPFITVQARRSDVMSAWSGIRPLVTNTGSEGATEAVSRDHVIKIDQDGLVTIAGGKWTTCRRMAQDVADCLGLTEKECVTKDLSLYGNESWTPTVFTQIAQQYTVPHRPGSIDIKVAEHLSRSYGSNAFKITKLAEEMKLGRRVVRGLPVIEAEVIHCIRNEYCLTLSDFIARRTRLCFLDTLATRQALPRVCELMSEELKWTSEEKERQMTQAVKYLETFECARS